MHRKDLKLRRLQLSGIVAERGDGGALLLARLTEAVGFPAGSVIHRDGIGDTWTCAYLLVEGKAVISHRDSPIAVVGPGAAIPVPQRSGGDHAVTALTDVLAYAVGRRELAILLEDPRTAPILADLRLDGAGPS